MKIWTIIKIMTYTSQWRLSVNNTEQEGGLGGGGRPCGVGINCLVNPNGEGQRDE